LEFVSSILKKMDVVGQNGYEIALGINNINNTAKEEEEEE
jgi:hypothetical protein